MKHKLLVVEPNEELATVLELMFSEKFQVLTANSTQQAVDLILKEHPQVAILDCDKNIICIDDIANDVEKQPHVERTAMIVLGTGLSDQAIKSMFKSGIADFVEKPFNVVAFHQRIIRFSRDFEEIKRLHENDKRKHSLAQSAMKQSSVYGSGLDLLAKLNNVQDIDSFLSMVTKSIKSLGYHCAVEFRYQDQSFSLDSDIGPFSEVERRVFQLLHDKGRIYSFGSRMMFNDKQSSILIKNMPVMGTTSYDAAIDLFAKLIPALDARFISLKNQITMRETSATLTESIAMIKAQLTTMEISRRDRLNEVATAISLSFHELELTDVQESFFLNLIEQKLEQNSSDETFNNVVTLLSACAEKLEQETAEAQTLAVQEEDDDDDMELF